MEAHETPASRVAAVTKVDEHNFGALNDEQRLAVNEFIRNLALADTVSMYGVRAGEAVPLNGSTDDEFCEFDDIVVNVSYSIHHTEYSDMEDAETLRKQLL